jgi:hypothetical protein
MWSTVITRIKKDPNKWLTQEVKNMLIDLDLDINDAEVIDALITQWLDNERVKNKDGTMSAYAKYMEDVRIKLINIKPELKDSFISQLLFGGGTYNREVLSVPCKSIIAPGILTAKGEHVTMYSPEWIWKASMSFFEQYCHKKGISVNKASPEQKEYLGKFYKQLTKVIHENKLRECNTSVYMSWSFIQMQNASDIQILISQYMYGGKDTCALVSTSGGGFHSFDIMNKEMLQNSGGISYTNEKGKKMIAGLLFKRTDELMSKAVDDALAKQAEEAADVDVDVPYVHSEKKRRAEAPYSGEIPIIDKDGKILTIPFQNFSTCKTQFVFKESNYSNVKGCSSQGTRSTRGDCGVTKGGGNSGNHRKEDNTIDAKMLKAFDEITITTCARGDDICAMPLIAIDIPDEPTFLLQPGAVHVNVVFCCDYHPAKWRGAKLETEADIEREVQADIFYFVDKMLKNSLKARTHLRNGLVNVLNSNNTMVLNKASFNHLNTNSLTEDDKLLLKNSVSGLHKNRFNPFAPDMIDFANFDIDAFCQAKIVDPILAPAPASSLDSETVPVMMETELVSAPDPAPAPAPAPASASSLDSETVHVTMETELISAPDPAPALVPVPALTQESGPVQMETNFVTWDDNESISEALLVSLGNKPFSSSAPKLMLKCRQHDGKDDEVGEQIDAEFFEVFDEGTYRHVKIKVDTGLLIRVEIRLNIELDDITPVYINSTGEEEPESEISLKVNEVFELPFPLNKEAGEEPDSWMIRCGSVIQIKITFILK